MGTDAAVAILGGGKIGEALLAGLVRAGGPSDVVVSERYRERADQLVETYGVQALSPDEAAASARTLVVAVKPHDVDAVLEAVAPSVGPDHLVVSVAAGVTSAQLEAGLPDGVPVVRCMPNTPALLGEGMTALAPGTRATSEHLDRAEAVLAAVGRVVRVDESQLDAVTALSGSGPAYFFLFAEAMIEAGVALGLARPLATELVEQTALGSATMLRDSGDDATALRQAVSSPAGTTVAALRELERHGLRAAVQAAAEAAARRSAELGRAH
ncbi:pyrroline-5-carboxylate reductase [Jatrophihabitans endophyticus]|uniref:pyrroline-5-carboxylate reductase n=1 Tax=Jatrophihabitans endophyticus TaxID=1206085 RepID=UPI0019DA6AA8|nr:pyrroline-5-carboxylate reductase [Jatrophihabitans endophyticus]MBE7187466.1 pyrroline-5-carboxylate reductase [Jatrophihabitans endophyticus]